MKTKVVASVFVMVLIVVSFSECKNTDKRELGDYCYTINGYLKELEFARAEIAGNKLRLFDSEGNVVQEIPFYEYDETKKIRSIRKDGEVLYFVLFGSVDDERGLMFVNDGSDRLLDGLRSVERAGGNYYVYSTS